MKWQLCQYCRRNGDAWQDGIAALTEFGTHDIKFIVDSDGMRLKFSQVYNYRLVESPLAYIDSNYR